jgi:HSP20 family protein
MTKENKIKLEDNGDVGELTVDVYETDREVVVQSAIAGVTSDQLDIALEQDILVIKGSRDNPVNDENKNYFIKECYFGPFEKEVILPKEVDISQIKASMDNGLLTIKLPKLDLKQKKIQIEE